MKKPKLYAKYLLLSLCTCLLFLGLWFSVTTTHLVSPVFIPSPQEVWKVFLNIAFAAGYKGSSLWLHLGISLERVGAAFLAAALLAVPLGFLSGYSRSIKSVLSPVIQFYRPLPPLAYYTVLIIWLGIGEMSKVSLLFLAGFAPIYLACVSAVENVDPARLIVARTLGAKTRQLFFYVIVPSCLPEVITGLRTALGFIFTTLVAAEMVAASSGVGWMVLDASKFLKSDVMFVGIIFMGLTAIAIDGSFLLLERLLVPWKGKGS